MHPPTAPAGAPPETEDAAPAIRTVPAPDFGLTTSSKKRTTETAPVIATPTSSAPFAPFPGSRWTQVSSKRFVLVGPAKALNVPPVKGSAPCSTCLLGTATSVTPTGTLCPRSGHGSDVPLCIPACDFPAQLVSSLVSVRLPLSGCGVPTPSLRHRPTCPS